MSEPPPDPSPADGTQQQTPAQLARLLSARPQLTPGEPVPNREMWVLERQLGIGGFGEVWLAKHEWKDERVAVKFCTHPAARHRLVTHEKRVIARVMKHGGDHPNIVPLLDCNLSGETPWLIYVYVPGGTLAEAVQGWKGVPFGRRLARTVRVMHALAGALGTFHRLEPPIVHRDMKPQNVLMAGSVPRITDFGLGGAVLTGALADTANSLSGQSAMLPPMLRAMGTLRYASQEQMSGSAPDPRDDVYALGIIAYQMVMCDLRAVPGTDTADELRALRVPGELIALIVKSVATNPERRPKDATECERELAKLLPAPGTVLSPSLQGPPPAPYPTTETEKCRIDLDLGGGIDPTTATTATPTTGSAPTATRAPTEHELRAMIEADFETGESYYHGREMPQDYEQARACYERAAAQGHAAAQYCLAVIHHFGYGVPQDYAKAHEWYEKAAECGNTAAQNNLGVLAELGRGVPQDYNKAREWYEKAATRGYAAAQNKLGVLYDLGRGGPQDYTKARGWYARAAAQGHVAARYNLGMLSEHGRGTLQDYAMAREWYEEAAAQGHARAQYNLGAMYDFGRGVPQDYEKAREWYEKAAAQGEAVAQSDLGVLYELGRGVPQDYEKAREWYEKAAAQDHARAKAYLAELYENGGGVKKNIHRAMELYREAAEQGEEYAKDAINRLKRRS